MAIFARELKEGDLFTVCPSELHSGDKRVRRCLESTKKSGVRWGYVGEFEGWWWIGGQCRVELVQEKKFNMREDYMETLEKMFPKGFVIAWPDRDGQGMHVEEHNPKRIP